MTVSKEVVDLLWARIAEVESILFDAQQVMINKNSAMVDEMRVINRIDRYRRDNECLSTSPAPSVARPTTTV